jgi:hypothetical protein
MPYIEQSKREELNDRIPDNAGELNYAFSIIAWDYFDRHHNYQGINDIIGALEGAKLEFYRRKVGDYENIKILENGDI